MPVDPIERERFEARYFLLAEQRIAECMSQAGFVYIPRTPTAEKQLAPGGSAEQGFGITSRLIASVSPGAQERAAVVDPNDEIVAALPERERAMYTAVLEGLPPILPDATPDEVFEALRTNISDGGCRDTGRSAADSELGINRMLQAKFDETLQRSLGDKRVVDAQLEWSRCMTKYGYDFEDDGAMFTYIGNEGFAVMNRAAAGSGGRVDSPEVLAELDRVLARELAIWKADVDCSHALDDALHTVRQEVIDEYTSDS